MLILATLSSGAAHATTPETVIVAIQDDIQHGDLDSAKQKIDSALKADPQNGGLYNLRGIVHASHNELAAAESDFDRAIHLSPHLVSAYLNLGRACELENAGNFEAIDRAIARYRDLLKIEPGAANVRIQLSKLLEWKGAFSQSLDMLDVLPKTDRETKLPLLLRCADLAGLRRMGEARAVAEKLQNEQDLQEADVNEVVLALAAVKADKIVVQLLTVASKHQDLSTSGLKQLASSDERLGDLDGARNALEQMSVRDPASVDTLLELARIAQKQNRLEAALGYLAHARDLRPDYAPIHFFFGIVAVQLDLPVEAKKSLQKALDLDPENPAYNYARGSVELQGKSAWDAIPYFKKFTAAMPAEPRGHFALGVAEFSSQDYPSAIKELTLAAHSAETRAGAEYFLGRIAKVDGDWASAAQHFQRSIEGAPNYSEAHAELGLARMHTGDLSGARAELDQALRLNPSSYLTNANVLAFYQRTRDPRLEAQKQKMAELETKRFEKQELMLRTIQASPQIIDPSGGQRRQ